jgi:hypothetical protein
MVQTAFERSVFINCPFDREYAPLLEAATFCVVYFGFVPRLANVRIEAGENRFDKIVGLIRNCKYSIHDLSRCKSTEAGESFRMNMPFEFGIDMGMRRSGSKRLKAKKFLVFEERQYDLKASLSDIAGQDVEFHNGDYERLISKTRDFFRVEAGVRLPGPKKVRADYTTFQGWVVEKKISEGFSEEEALQLPSQERIDEMNIWVRLGLPIKYEVP